MISKDLFFDGATPHPPKRGKSKKRKAKRKRQRSKGSLTSKASVSTLIGEQAVEATKKAAEVPTAPVCWKLYKIYIFWIFSKYFRVLNTGITPHL